MSRRPSSGSPVPWVIALVVVAAAIAIWRSGGADTVPVEEETAMVEVSGSPLPLYGVPDDALGLAAPTVTSTLLSGEKVEIGPDGTARLIAFFAHWCPHCQAEVPEAKAWIAETPPPEGVEVLAVSTSVSSDAPNYPPSAWFEREGWPTPVVLDDEAGTIAGAYGLTGFPFWVAVDADGTVVARISGSIDRDQFRSLLAAITPADPAAAG